MLKVSKNSRQIPKNVEICGNKKYYDILYAYLQYIAVRCDDKWYVDKSEINFSKLGRKFDLTRQTVATKFKNLKELGLIEEIEGEEKYLLTPMDKNFAALIPYETLKLLTDTLSHNTISTYIYLLNRAHANGYQPYQFTIEQIKKFIGISTNTRSNNDIVFNILYVLQKIGLIEYSIQGLPQDNDNFQNIKTIYQLDKIVNTL